MREFRKNLKLVKPPPPAPQPASPQPLPTPPKAYPALILYILGMVFAWAFVAIEILAVVGFVWLLLWGLFNGHDFTLSTREWHYILIKIVVATAVFSAFIAGDYAISIWRANRRYSKSPRHPLGLRHKCAR